VFVFMADAGLGRLTLLPYNPASGAKYEWLCRAYEIQGETQDPARLDEILQAARQAGLEASIG
jgi:hypothetical protein